MAAGRFRPPKTHTPARQRQPLPGVRGRGVFVGKDGIARVGAGEYEPEPAPVLRVSRTGIRNMPAKQQAALRKERKADPAGPGIHSWRRRQWASALSVLRAKTRASPPPSPCPPATSRRASWFSGLAAAAARLLPWRRIGGS